MALKSEQIAAAIANHIYSNLTVVTTVSWFGSRIDTQGISDWLEVWISEVNTTTRRKRNKDQRNVLIEVKAFAKRTADTYRVLDLEKDIVDVLEHADFVIRDYSTVGNPAVGWMRVYEQVTDERTREQQNSKRTDTRALSVVFRGYAQGD
jgi:hypothetical protein